MPIKADLRIVLDRSQQAKAAEALNHVSR
jgi:hypothetical protein